VAPARAPAELLPEGTGVAVTVASARHLLRVLDVEALVATYRPYYEQAAAYTEQSLGHNLLDLNRWREIGVDPDGPVGGALLDANSGASCLFFTLSDPPRFRDFLDHASANLGELEVTYEDRGIVLAPGPKARTKLVLRDDFAFLVMVRHPNLVPYDHARELASVDPARSLANSRRWKEALGEAPPRDLVAYVDVGGMIGAEIAEQRRREEAPSPGWAEQELQRLRELGAASEEIARWEQVADEQRAADAQQRERRRRQLALWEATLGPLGPIVFELSLGPQAIAGTTRAQAPESALLRRIVRPGEGPPWALTAASERVLFGAGGNFDVPEALQAVDSLLRIGGSNLEAAWMALKREGGDPRAALELLDGSVSFALTVKDPAALASPQAQANLGFNLALGFKEAAKAEAMVAAVMGTLPTSRLGIPGAKVRRDRAGGYVVAVPQWREVHVDVVGSTLAISTDPKFAQQLGRATRWAPRQAPAGPVLAAREAAAVLMFDWVTLAAGLASRAEARPDPRQNQPYWRFPAVAHATIDAVPQSAAYKAKLREWQRLDAKLERAERAQQRRKVALALAAGDSLGTIALHLRETADGLMTEGGQFFGAGGLVGVIERAVDGLSGEETDHATRELRERVEREIQEIRVRDIERALAVRGD
jgi:hypothetical protein